jgi:hypothetical protein
VPAKPKIKRTKTGPARTKKRPLKAARGARHVTAPEAERMFAFWAAGDDGSPRSMETVAKHFKRGVNTVKRARLKYDWPARLQKILNEQSAKTDKAVGKKVATTREIIQGVFNKIAKELLNPDVKIEVKTTEEFASLTMRLNQTGRTLLDLEGEGGGGGNNTTNIFQYIKGGTVENVSDTDLCNKHEQYGAWARRDKTIKR